MLTSDDKSIDARGLVQGKNSSNRETITRLFQTKSLAAMAPGLFLKCDWSGREISGLTRIFHTDRNEEAAKADGVGQTSILMPGCMCPYCPNQNVSLT